MSSDWKETRESEGDHQVSGMTDVGQRSMQGFDEGEKATERIADRSFNDRQGRDITVRTFAVGDQYYIRAYDRDVRMPPKRVDTGQAGRANLRIESNDNRKRARLQDIEVPPAYQGNGIGHNLLMQAEKIAKRENAHEIYGQAPDDEKTRNWYLKRAYNLREEHMGAEVFKKL